MSLPLVTEYDHGICAIDAQYHRPKRAAIHLIIEHGKVAIVDTGTAFSIDGVVETLENKNISFEDVDYVMLTHIHLDHAGGASECMRRFPNAKLVVHPRGARHMADPTKLIAGVISVYGESEFKRVYGEIHPIDASRIIEAPDQFHVNLNGRDLLLLDTPGHARHHYCIFDERSHSFFTGDTLGVSYRELDANGLEFVFPTTTPVQFDPIAAHTSIDTLMQYDPKYAYLTHYSRIGNLVHHTQSMHQLIDDYVEIATQSIENGADRFATIADGIRNLLTKGLNAHGCLLSQEEIHTLLKSDIKLNTQGLEYWLDHDRQQTQ